MAAARGEIGRVSVQVAFIGLGIMGEPMAANLVAAGHEVIVANRSREPVERLVVAGARSATTFAEAAEAAEIVITMLPDSPQVADVVAGAGGVLDGARPGTLLVDMSSIAPATARQLADAAAERGCAMLDAPVSGGDAGARAGTLSIMVGGAEADVERARPLLESLGSTVVHVGPNGAGQVVKACNQVVVALTIEAVSEALVLGSKAGVAPALVLDVLSGGLAGNRVMEVRRANFLDHDFEPGFRAALHQKDLGIALDTAREQGVALPVTAVVAELMRALIADGGADRDHTALLTVLERLANHEIGGPAPEVG